MSGSKTVSKCPMRKRRLPFLEEDELEDAAAPDLRLATKCPARLIESGIATHSVVNPAFSNSFANKAPTFFTPSIFKVPLLIFTDSLSISIACGICASIQAITCFSSLVKPLDTAAAGVFTCCAILVIAMRMDKINRVDFFIGIIFIGNRLPHTI